MVEVQSEIKAISETDWNQVKVEKIPKLKGKLFIGIKYGVDGTNVALSIAVENRGWSHIYRSRRL
ncbi:hypothetical protein MGH68_12025 [Erysipelothrix sp. D19-032]